MLQTDYEVGGQVLVSPAGPQAAASGWGRRGGLFLPVFISFSFLQVCLATFAHCILGQKDRRPTGCKP